MRNPLRFNLDVPGGVKLSVKSGEAPRPKAETDIDPRGVSAGRRGVAGGPDGKDGVLDADEVRKMGEKLSEQRKR